MTMSNASVFIGFLVLSLLASGCGYLTELVEDRSSRAPAAPSPSPSETRLVMKNSVTDGNVSLQGVPSGGTFSVVQAPTSGFFELLNSQTGAYRYWAPTYGVQSETVVLRYDPPGDADDRLVTLGFELQSLAAKTRHFTELYSGHQGDGFDLKGWKTHASSFGITSLTRQSSSLSLRPNLPPQSARTISLVSDAGSLGGLASPEDYAPFSSPINVAGQMPYAAEVLHQPDCSAEVEVTAPFFWQHFAGSGHASEPAGLYGVLLNFSTRGEGLAKQMDGYMILVNPGGQSMTLARIARGNDHAFGYLDMWPGYRSPGHTMNCPISGMCLNPMTSGPYRNWDYWHIAGFGWENYPAGGNPAETSNTIAARYVFDPISRGVTIEWELRTHEGVDQTPATWDNRRILVGDDALPPIGGGYGPIVIHYGGMTSRVSDVVNLSAFSLKCTHVE